MALNLYSYSNFRVLVFVFRISSGMGDPAYFYVHMIFALNGLLASGIALLGTFIRCVHHCDCVIV